MCLVHLKNTYQLRFLIIINKCDMYCEKDKY